KLTTETEEKLSKVDKRISHATAKLETYRKRAKDLEEELEKTTHYYQGRTISCENKAQDNWFAARTAERSLNDLRKQNAHNRLKLTEIEFKFELFEKDLYVQDVPNTPLGREHSPYGPSPLGRLHLKRELFCLLQLHWRVHSDCHLCFQGEEEEAQEVQGIFWTIRLPMKEENQALIC
ncbi:Melanoma inhibitory activity protein 2, partial [Saguinus oedipus]